MPGSEKALFADTHTIDFQFIQKKNPVSKNNMFPFKKTKNKKKQESEMNMLLPALDYQPTAGSEGFLSSDELAMKQVLTVFTIPDK